MIAVIASWNWLASTLLMECKRATAGLTFPSHLSSNFSKIAYAGLGNIGVVVTDVSIIITLLGVCIAFQITFATLLREVPGIYLSNTGLTILSGVIVLPMCFVLFTGAIRFNLDPLGEFSEDELCTALEMCKIAQTLTSAAAQGGSGTGFSERGSSATVSLERFTDVTLRTSGSSLLPIDSPVGEPLSGPATTAVSSARRAAEVISNPGR